MGGDVFPAPEDFDPLVYARSHPIVIQAIKEIGLETSGDNSDGMTGTKLTILEVPTFALPTSSISEYDGLEDINWSVAGALVDIVKAHDPATITLEETRAMLIQMQALAAFHVN
jgi:hypothetical protein